MLNLSLSAPPGPFRKSLCSCEAYSITQISFLVSWGWVDRKAKSFMPVSRLAVCAGAFGDAVTEIHEILGWLLNEIPRRKAGPMFSTGNARAAP
jgi:hypothetical protein